MVAVDKLVLAGNKLSFGRPWALLEHVASPWSMWPPPVGMWPPLAGAWPPPRIRGLPTAGAWPPLAGGCPASRGSHVSLE